MSYQSVFRPDLFKGQTVIVTGGGSGLGRCAAHELSALGAHVALVGRRVEKLEAVAAEIAEDGGSAEQFTPATSATKRPSAARSRPCFRRAARIDGLVNNAGGQYRAAMETISTKGFEAVVRNNLTGGFIFMREAYNRWMAGARRRHRQHHRRYLERLAGVRAFRRRAWRHVDADRNRRLRMGGGGRSRQRRRAGRHRFERLRHLSPGGAGEDPRVSANGADAEVRHRSPRSPPPSSICCRRPRPTSPAPACASTAAPRMRDAPGRWPRRSAIRLSTAFTAPRRRSFCAISVSATHRRESLSSVTNDLIPRAGA